MTVGKYLSTYLRVQDCQGEMVVTIATVMEETIGREDSETKLVCSFAELDRALVLNQTTIGQLVAVLGSQETEEWIGKRATLFRKADVPLRGKHGAGLRFRPAPEVEARASARLRLRGKPKCMAGPPNEKCGRATFLSPATAPRLVPHRLSSS